jgi:hypothetical protein
MLHKEFVTPFWQRAYESLPSGVRGQYLTHMKAAEGWELALAELIQLASRAKTAILKLFQTPSRAH